MGNDFWFLPSDECLYDDEPKARSNTGLYITVALLGTFLLTGLMLGLMFGG